MHLASIQKIINLESIPNADSIEKATILGWEVVVKKGEFNIGDKVCYIQIDTVVPPDPYFEFLKDRKYRVRTIKLRGQISQGLIIPAPIGNWKEGDDLTELMKITKYEKPDTNPQKYEKPREPKTFWAKHWYRFKYDCAFKWFPFLKPKYRSPFPKHLVPITDEERIQNIPDILRKYQGKPFITSYKLDGSSITIIHSKSFGKSRFRICSRRFELHDKHNDWYKVFNATDFKSEILKLVKQYGTNDIIVQGEAVGTFNGNYHNIRPNQIYIFNIYVNGKRINQEELINTCKANNIPHCPMYKKVILNHTMDEILEFSKIKDVLNPTVEAEGLVWRCLEDNQSFKVINNNFLIKNNE